MNKYFGIFKELKELELPVGDMDLYEGYFAEFYDEFTGTSTKDVEAFLPHIEATEGKVLELACGTGRLLLEIAQQGHAVTGIDLSDSMLSILEDKLSNEPSSIQNKVQLYKEDMTSFNFDEQFGTCLLGATSICLLPDDEAVLKMFQSVYDHLQPGGRFIFDYSISPTTPKKPIEIEPIRTFTKSNEENKQFVLIGEKKDYNKWISNVNFYAEIIDRNLKTVRNFGNTQKRLLTDQTISSLIKKSPFKLKDSTVWKNENFKVRFVVLEKEESFS
jgi:ubiquinone/menaquinone biosynthesis C-methylase UbiE